MITVSNLPLVTGALGRQRAEVSGRRQQMAQLVVWRAHTGTLDRGQEVRERVVEFLERKGVIGLDLIENAGPLVLREARVLRRVLEEGPREAEAGGHHGFIANLSQAFVEYALFCGRKLPVSIGGIESGTGGGGGHARKSSFSLRSSAASAGSELMRFVDTVNGATRGRG